MKKYCGNSPRDRNYKAGTLYGGSLSNEIKCGACPGQRAVVDSHACTLTLAINILAYIADSVSIYHGPNGCLDETSLIAMIINKFRATESQNPYQWEMRNIHLCSSNLNEQSIIYGGEQKLALAIREAKKRYNPSLIAVLVSCSAAIIGDDVDMVCKEAEEEFNDGTYCIPVHAQGFQTHSWINYTDCIWTPIVERVIKQPEEINNNMVNFFRSANTSNMDVEEAERLLSRLDLEVNVLPDLQSIHAFERCSEAILNTGLCYGYMLPITSGMHEKFGIPYTQTPYALGTDFTTQWLEEVGEKTGRLDLAKELIKEEKERIMPELEIFRKKFAGKKAMIVTSHSKTLGLAQVCHDLGLDIVCLISHFSDKSINTGKMKLLKQIGDVEFLVGSPIYEIIHKVSKEKPDIILSNGEVSPVLAQLSFASKSMYLYNMQHAHFGFQGILELGKIIERAMLNPFRKKMLTYARNQSGMNWGDIPFLKQEESTKYIPETHYAL
ncbi:MAG: hypothetical protein JXB88_21935 [Spirochaetales bacterium]|nr:hypothetical protein [Spirochaetales bacterium]